MIDFKCPELWNLFNSRIDPSGMGHLMPGRFLSATTKGPTYNYPYFAINFKDHRKREGE